MSASSRLCIISSWYSATMWGCVGVILTIASKAMYLTTRQPSSHSALTVLVAPLITEIPSQFTHADARQRISLLPVRIKHASNDTGPDAFVQQRDGAGRRD